MKNILNKFHINYYTYIFILLCFLCGYIKNILIIFFICIIHEFGHIFFTKLFKYEIVKVEILPFGGFTTINKRINSSILRDIIISFGGIFSQLILVSILYICKKHFNIITYNLFIKYNIILIIFNLIPIIPLDGSKIIHLLLEILFPYQFSYYLNFYFSLFFLMIFILINYHFKLDNYFILSFLLYKIIMYYKEYKYIHNRFLLERSMYTLNYYKIDNNTKKIKDLKKNVLHYFKKDNKYIKEDRIINEFLANKFDKSQDFW